MRDASNLFICFTRLLNQLLILCTETFLDVHRSRAVGLTEIMQECQSLVVMSERSFVKAVIVFTGVTCELPVCYHAINR